MTNAAEEGTPFCEECEQAAQEQASENQAHQNNNHDTQQESPTSEMGNSANSSSQQQGDSAPVSPVNSEANESPIPLCELTSISAQCQHSRESQDNYLDVVPAESGDLIKLTAQINDNCGEHAEWDIRGPMGFDTQRGVTAEFRANHWRVGAGGSWFIPDAIPQKYEIEARSCSGSEKLVVYSYPSDKQSFKVNGFGKDKTFSEKMDFIEESMDAYLKKFKFTKTSGSVSASAQWVESTDHNSFYRYQISGGFNPLIGLSVRVPFGPTAAIPNWIKRYGDIYMFVEFSGSITANVNIEKLKPNKHTAYIDVKGGIEGKVGASLFLMSENALKVEAFGSSGIAFKGWSNKQDLNTNIFLQSEWEGLKGTLSILLGWGWVEYTREWSLVDPHPIPKEPFEINVIDFFD